jgi:hypothetical protein
MPTGWKRWSGCSRLRRQAPKKPSRTGIDAIEPVPHLLDSDYHAAGSHEDTVMRDDTRNIPASDDSLTRFIGGSPLGVLFRLVLMSILVGVVLAAIGLDPWNILTSIRLLFQRLWDLGFDAISGVWRYFLLGAVIVIPIWLLTRLFGTPRGR